MAKGIQIKYRVSEMVPDGTHRLQIWTSDYNDIEPEIFVFQRMPPLPGGTDPVDKYANVASVADMEEYPINAPASDARPFFRLASADMVFRNMDLLNRTLGVINGDINWLIKNYNHYDTFSGEHTWDFNYEEYESSSSSSTSSSSSSTSSSSGSSTSSTSSDSSLLISSESTPGP